MKEKETILEVQNLKKYFVISDRMTVKAVDDVSFAIRRGEVLGLAGESGCGKSTLARCLAGIYRPTDGTVQYEKGIVSGKGAIREQQRRRQREVQMIFQDSAAALNPRMRIEQIIQEPLRIQCREMTQTQRRERMETVMRQVGLPFSLCTQYPGELSGGQRQRVAIARSLAVEPRLIIADEPVASLDVSIQAQILTLFRELQQEKNFAFFFIAHELPAVRFLSDRVGVMLKGRLVELAPTEELFGNPLHPYTKSLLSAIHIPDPVSERSRRQLDYDRDAPLGERMRERGKGHFVLEGV